MVRASWRTNPGGSNAYQRMVAMNTEKEKKRKRSYPAGLPTKTYWHLYSLQSLESDKLAKIVNKILRSEYMLIK